MPPIHPSVATDTANASRSGISSARENTALHEHFRYGNGSALARQISLFILRNEVKITGIQTTWLNRINLFSGKPVTSPQSGVVVSVTSYGDRLRTVHLTLESIAAGSVLPSRLILWVDTEEAFSNPSKELKRLIERGLELRLSQNFGPHTKYYPYLLETESFACPLVTADDDQLYRPWWLEGLLRSYSQDPASISCYRAHCVEIGDDTIAPYERWRPCRSVMPTYLNFATGVSGVLYPPSFLKHLKAAGSQFLTLCPKQDDAWLHVQALRAGTPVRQIYSRPLRFPVIPGSQSGGLFHTNVLLGQNDRQIGITYSSSDLAVLRACAASPDLFSPRAKNTAPSGMRGTL